MRYRYDMQTNEDGSHSYSIAVTGTAEEVSLLRGAVDWAIAGGPKRPMTTKEKVVSIQAQREAAQRARTEALLSQVPDHAFTGANDPTVKILGPMEQVLTRR